MKKTNIIKKFIKSAPNKIPSQTQLKCSHNVLVKLVLSFLICTHSNLSFSCIWQYETNSQSSPFWPSTTIEVCFLPPNPLIRGNDSNPLDQTYIDKYHENIETVKQTFEAQINQRTPFKLKGFQICEVYGRNVFDLDYKIRIDMNETQGNGANAFSIGPRSGSYGLNIIMSTLEFQWPNNIKPDLTSNTLAPTRMRMFNDSRHMSSTALHEVMHLLGFHHTESWDENFGNSDALSIIQVGHEPDLQSVMNRGVRNFDENGLAILSEQDVSCLNKVADQSIILLPSRPANL